MSRQVVITCEHGKTSFHDVRDADDWILDNCEGTVTTLDPDALPDEMIEAAAKAIAATYESEGNARGYAIISRPWDEMGEDEQSWWRLQAIAGLRAGLSAVGEKP